VLASRKRSQDDAMTLVLLAQGIGAGYVAVEVMEN